MGERISGDILAPHLFEMAKHHNINFYFLGGKKGVAEQAVNKIIDAYPWVKIVGHQHGYFEDHKSYTIVDLINSSTANIVFVGLSSPKDEK